MASTHSGNNARKSLQTHWLVVVMMVKVVIMVINYWLTKCKPPVRCPVPWFESMRKVGSLVSAIMAGKLISV